MVNLDETRGFKISLFRRAKSSKDHDQKREFSWQPQRHPWLQLHRILPQSRKPELEKNLRDTDGFSSWNNFLSPYSASFTTAKYGPCSAVPPELTGGSGGPRTGGVRLLSSSEKSANFPGRSSSTISAECLCSKTGCGSGPPPETKKGLSV